MDTNNDINKNMKRELHLVREMYTHFQQGDTEWMLQRFNPKAQNFEFFSQGPECEATENGRYTSIEDIRNKYFGQVAKNWKIQELLPKEFYVDYEHRVVHVIGEAKGFYVQPKKPISTGEESVVSQWDHTYWFGHHRNDHPDDKPMQKVEPRIERFREIWSVKREPWGKASSQVWNNTMGNW